MASLFPSAKLAGRVEHNIHPEPTKARGRRVATFYGLMDILQSWAVQRGTNTRRFAVVFHHFKNQVFKANRRLPP